MSGTYLHVANAPSSLSILNALFTHRLTPLPGWEPDDTGASVDWEALAGGCLGPSEKCVVLFARACASAELYGGMLPCAAQIRTAVAELDELALPVTGAA